MTKSTEVETLLQASTLLEADNVGPTRSLAILDRLRDIITNLNDRTEEAKQNKWLGKVEGLKISHAAAAMKLDQMERQLATNHTVDLGFPRPRGGHR